MVRGLQKRAIGSTVAVDRYWSVRATAVCVDPVLEIESGGTVSRTYAVGVQTQLINAFGRLSFAGTSQAVLKLVARWNQSSPDLALRVVAATEYTRDGDLVQGTEGYGNNL